MAMRIINKEDGGKFVTEEGFEVTVDLRHVSIYMLLILTQFECVPSDVQMELLNQIVSMLTMCGGLTIEEAHKIQRETNEACFPLLYEQGSINWDAMFVAVGVYRAGQEIK